MTSFIILATNLLAIEEKISGILAPYNIDQFDRTIIKREVDEKTDKVKQSLGISDVKRMQQKAFLTPLKSQTKAIILEEAELLTIEAQNALLKILEEPPAHTIIILVCTNIESLLPTIRSRCSILTLKKQTNLISERERQELQTVLTSISQWGIGESLNKAELLSKNKQEAISWLQNLILIAREKMLTQTATDQTNYPHLIRQLQQTLTTLSKTNANPRLQLESLFLSLQSTQ